MATVLHLLKGPDTTLARAVIEHHLRVGDRVTVVLLPGAGATDLPSGVPVRRVPDECSYDQLLDLIFDSDQVMTW